jgi:Ca-activated chloride channel family protein
MMYALDRHSARAGRRFARSLLLCAVFLAVWAGISGPVLAQEARLDAPARAVPGSEVQVTWQGPDAPGDFLAIADPGAPAASFLAYARTSAGSPAVMTAPETGDYEVRYISAAGLAVLARAPLRVAAEAERAMTAPTRADAGAEVVVGVAAAGDAADYVTIVAAGAPDTAFGPYARLKGAAEVRLKAPAEAGDYEIRHVQAAGQTVLARLPLTVEAAAPEAAAATPEAPPASSEQPVGQNAAAPAQETLPAPAPAATTLMALVAVDRGLAFRVAWEGPGAAGDWIGIVPEGGGADAAVATAAVEVGTPLGITAPEASGYYEIVYLAADGTVLGRRALEVR